MEQGAQFKFDSKNKAHVEALKNQDVEVHPGGFMSFRTPQKNSESKPRRKAVAPESKIERTVNPKKKTPNFLDKAREVEDAAKRRGDIKR